MVRQAGTSPPSKQPYHFQITNYHAPIQPYQNRPTGTRQYRPVARCSHTFPYIWRSLGRLASCVCAFPFSACDPCGCIGIACWLPATSLAGRDNSIQTWQRTLAKFPIPSLTISTLHCCSYLFRQCVHHSAACRAFKARRGAA